MILAHYCEFNATNSEINNAQSYREFSVDLTKMLIKVRIALQDRAKFIKENKNLINDEIENRFVNLLNSSEKVQ